ncbi:MAG TPA: hypothetical protein VJ276_20505 [Thermoanaerobaculia bacterium]|nr:hypothetical protein [Thermoanaerobaculia bacterium]
MASQLLGGNRRAAPASVRGTGRAAYAKHVTRISIVTYAKGHARNRLDLWRLSCADCRRVLTFIARFTHEDAAPRVAAFMLGSVAFAFAYRAFDRARRWFATDIPAVPSAKPNILYLRSFLDELVSLRSPSAGETHVFGRQPIGMQQLMFQPRAEDVLAAALAGAGRTVCLADPRESLQQSCTMRLTAEADWFEQFRRVALAVDTIIVLVGSVSAGLYAELAYLADNVPVSRIVLFLPYTSHAVDAVYHEFCAAAPPAFVAYLPESSRQAVFIYFGVDKRPQFIGSGLGFHAAAAYLANVIKRKSPQA